VRQAKGIKNRDDSIASAISLRKEAAPNVGHHYKRGKKIAVWSYGTSYLHLADDKLIHVYGP
jgi:hypothetical protein